MTYEFTSPTITAESANFDSAASSPDYFSHRFESWRLSGEIKDPSDIFCLIYHKNPKSPSGRLLAATLYGDEAVEILKRHGRI